jgi:hypothetical protein
MWSVFIKIDVRLFRMSSYKKTLFAVGVAATLAATSSSSFAQFALPKAGGSAPAPQGAVDASVSQDQLVKSYVAADSEALLGQSKMAEALGLKDKAAAAKAKADTLTSGATVTGDTLKGATQVQTDVADAVSKAQSEGGTLSAESKAQFSEGLGHMGRGLLGTVKLKDSAVAFQKAAQAKISSASMLEKMSVTKSLAAGTYVATNLPGHVTSLGSGLKSALSFAQSHNIPVPADATAALSALE